MVNEIPLLPIKLKGFNLKLYNSVHEQREFNMREIPKKGQWVEIGKFKRVVERFDIEKRYECVSRKDTENEITIKLKKVDLQKYDNEANLLIDRIMEKHKEVLTKTITILMIKGLYKANRQVLINRQMIKVKHANNKTEMTAELCKLYNTKKKQSLINRIENLKLKLADMEAEENGQQGHLERHIEVVSQG